MASPGTERLAIKIADAIGFTEQHYRAARNRASIYYQRGRNRLFTDIRFEAQQPVTSNARLAWIACNYGKYDNDVAQNLADRLKNGTIRGNDILKFPSYVFWKAAVRVQVVPQDQFLAAYLGKEIYSTCIDYKPGLIDEIKREYGAFPLVVKPSAKVNWEKVDQFGQLLAEVPLRGQPKEEFLFKIARRLQEWDLMIVPINIRFGKTERGASLLLMTAVKEIISHLNLDPKGRSSPD